ncbi:MAG TPA: glycoside hydrolase family 3 C-terminal domain-containing protein [Solirubrobacteraceae bacterium]|nr:glycoside hydrolase family 3 C-terminal domain-containing protein [Solirubrobacteraceae bacterium]
MTPTSSAAFGALETQEALGPEAIEARAAALLEQLSLEEKIELMGGDTPFWAGIAEMFKPGGYSSRPWVAGEIARLGVPGVRFADGPRGVILQDATTFPVSMARGATWDPDLEERIGDAIGREMRALGANFFGGVCINLLRHPAWGRAQETYGEDTHHLGALGAALARGVQRHVMACVKHFALNSMENARFTVDVTIDPRSLHEVYLPHFRRVVDEGVASVMSAYNSVNGEWAGQNRELLSGILKETWGFDGFVMTDFIWGMRDARTAALAGQDVEMPFRNHFDRDLAGLVRSGEVPEARVDDAALRVLRQLVRFGQGRDPADYGPEVVASESHRALAREAAHKGIVLLKNEGGALPLRDVRRVAVIGRLAAVPNTGDGGSSNTRPPYVVTPLEGLRDVLGDAVAVEHDDGSDPARAAELARGADAAVVVVGYTHDDEGENVEPAVLAQFEHLYPRPAPEDEELARRLLAGTTDEHGMPPGGDRVSLALHAADQALIGAVAAASPRTIVAVMAGSAVITEGWRDDVEALLMLWYPGMEGGRALADVLSGAVNPSGRLPCSFPARDEDLPFFDRDATAITYDLWHGYRKLDRDGAAPAFPFGFGLSYTTFELSGLRLDGAQLRAGDTLGVTVAATNSGEVAGEDVVQLYVEAPGSAVERAPRELEAFARVRLAPGETRDVRLEVPIADLAHYDAERGWVVEPLEYVAVAARHVRDPDALRAPFRVA